ncbi:hypothetical protein [Azomonas macrocytogenes]|uniref:ABC-type multidrug transport system permease subunit n=1 Tax=Azomonas macrocytogenes TaxID=69962 RepID=A0A839TB96_AZOMA|nr:hypothetical protein [Azomonas macrocytogenes]MBB3105325.1 ABC-type multidrug transport system permease subunit [Azomonas macrocytogenes]
MFLTFIRDLPKILFGMIFCGVVLAVLECHGRLLGLGQQALVAMPLTLFGIWFFSTIHKSLTATLVFLGIVVFFIPIPLAALAPYILVHILNFIFSAIPFSDVNSSSVSSGGVNGGNYSSSFEEDDFLQRIRQDLFDESDRYERDRHYHDRHYL